MKLCFAADLHGSLPATEQLLQRFEHSGADWLILLGDLLYHGPRNSLPVGYQPAKVAELLNQYADRIIAVSGNCDSEVDQMLLQFPITAKWQQVLLPGQRLFLTHGHHFSPENLPPLQQGDLFVYGHTHLPVAEQCDDIYLLNPGSASLPKGGYPASYGMLIGSKISVLTLERDECLKHLDMEGCTQ